ncbi:MAG: hypothetical protein J0H95_07205 [Xanthomonadales bacterium]|nr:hypothetical protein [Xanthomonadales bacterium]
MRIPAAILLISLISGCTSQTEDVPEAVVSAPAPTAATEIQPTSVPAPVTEEQPASAPLGWVPDQACNFIGKDFGVEIRPYQNEYEDEYSCSTPYKNLQEAVNLPNNLAYYVTGNRDLATEVKLVLNINEPSKQAYAKGQLKKFSAVVAKAATGAGLPSEISNAITSGTPKIHDGAGYRQELKRDNWPTGKGYELHYIVTKVGEG